MTRPRIEWRRWACSGLALLALGGLAATTGAAPAAFLVNESPSLPRGLYVRLPGAVPVRGAVVALPQPPTARRYLARQGMPSEVRLIKRVAATTGDRVCREEAAVLAAGRVAPVRLRDRRGAALPQWRGCRRLARGELFLLGDTTDSFDSRYFGPVDAEALDGVFRETLTW